MRGSNKTRLLASATARRNGDERFWANNRLERGPRLSRRGPVPFVVELSGGGNMKRGQVVGLLCGALLAGCVSAGVEVSPEQMSNFKPGVTTRQEVITALGPASVQTALDDGSTLLVYTYVKSRPPPGKLYSVDRVAGWRRRHALVSRRVPVRSERHPQKRKQHGLERWHRPAQRQEHRAGQCAGGRR